MVLLILSKRLGVMKMSSISFITEQINKWMEEQEKEEEFIKKMAFLVGAIDGNLIFAVRRLIRILRVY